MLDKYAEKNCRDILMDLLEAEVHGGRYARRVLGGDLKVRIRAPGGGTAGLLSGRIIESEAGVGFCNHNVIKTHILN